MTQPFERNDAHKGALERLRVPSITEANASAALAYAVLAAGEYVLRGLSALADAMTELSEEVRLERQGGFPEPPDGQ